MLKNLPKRIGEIQINPPKNAMVFYFVLIALAGVYVIHYVTNWGPIIYSDSIAYIEAANNLMIGRGIGIDRPYGAFHHMAHYPPLYPIALAVVSVTGLDLQAAAQWVGIFTFGATVFIIGFLLHKVTDSMILSITPVALMISNTSIVMIYSAALSEALFFFLIILHACVLFAYLKRPGLDRLLSASILASLTILTRHIGVVVILTGILSIWFLQRNALKKKIMHSSIFAFLSSAPYILWRISLRNKYTTFDTLDFNIGNIWKELERFRKYLVETVWEWLPYNASLPSVHYRTKLLVLILIVLGCVILYGYTIHRSRKQLDRKWLDQNPVLLNTYLLLFSFVYLSALAFSFAFVKPIPYGGKLLLPISLICCVLPFGLWYHYKTVNPSKSWTLFAVLIVAAAAIASSAATTYDKATQLHENGTGYTTANWRSSETIDAVKRLPVDVPIISNEVDAILLFTDRVAYRIEEIFQEDRRETFTRYGDDSEDAVQRLFQQEGAALILFDTIEIQFRNIYYEKSPERLQAFLDGLILATDFSDGAIYFYPKSEHDALETTDTD